MQEKHRKKLYKIWRKSWEMHGITPTHGALDMIFKVLSKYKYADVKRSIIAYSNNGKKIPTPSDIIQRIAQEREIEFDKWWSYSGVNTLVNSFDDNQNINAGQIMELIQLAYTAGRGHKEGLLPESHITKSVLCYERIH